LLEIKNVTKKFGQTVAVNNVSFSVNKGEVVGFLGPNGAGKTTTMRIITCYLPADSGKVNVSGFDVFDDSLEVRKRIGYLPESAPLYYDMGVIEFLNYIAEIRGIPKNTRKSKIDKMIELCSLQKVLGKDIGELSKGYKQRVGLAQAMVHDPELLVLDEPTIGLDPNQIIEIRELIKTLGEEKTIILSTHILPEVTATCTRVIIINDGVIAAQGTPEELTSQAKGGIIIYLTIKGNLEIMKQKFANLPDITEYRVIEEKSDSLYQFRIKSQIDISNDLFQLAVQNNWNLSELRKEALTLEDVFTKITAQG
jgi:ABC-2 type transport system ATP-binding protein